MIKTNPQAAHRHSGRGGHADRKSFHRAKGQPYTLADAVRFGLGAVESARTGCAAMAAYNAQIAARIVLDSIGRE